MVLIWGSWETLAKSPVCLDPDPLVNQREGAEMKLPKSVHVSNQKTRMYYEVCKLLETQFPYL